MLPVTLLFLFLVVVDPQYLGSPLFHLHPHPSFLSFIPIFLLTPSDLHPPSLLSSSSLPLFVIPLFILPPHSLSPSSALLPFSILLSSSLVSLPTPPLNSSSSLPTQLESPPHTLSLSSSPAVTPERSTLHTPVPVSSHPSLTPDNTSFEFSSITNNRDFDASSKQIEEEEG